MFTLRMPMICGHGGGCCGIAHLYGFPNHSNEPVPDETRKKYREKLFEFISKEGFFNEDNNSMIALEACLTHRQSFARSILEDLGFKVVATWHNRNTTNRVYKFVLCSKPIKSAAAIQKG